MRHNDNMRLLVEVRDLLINLQPHIPQACQPGKESFIDAYVDTALARLTTLLDDYGHTQSTLDCWLFLRGAERVLYRFLPAEWQQDYDHYCMFHFYKDTEAAFANGASFFHSKGWGGPPYSVSEWLQSWHRDYYDAQHRLYLLECSLQDAAKEAVQAHNAVVDEVERLRPHYKSQSSLDVARRQMLDHFEAKFPRKAG